MDATQTPQSIYHPLSDNRKEIRLLHIQPALRHTDPIHCSLTTAFLDDGAVDGGPYYEALSYAWGLDTHASPVYLQGVSKTVTVNLYHALQHLRHASKERVMWIDALCIDQKNFTERTHQVGMMRDVYGRASSTTVWLGLSTGDECDLAMKFLARLGSDEDLHICPPLMPCVEVEGRDLLSSEITAGLKSFFSSPWWSRVWTVQEWILSRNATFQHGLFLLEGRIVQKVVKHWKNHVYLQSCCLTVLRHLEGQFMSYYFSKLNYIVKVVQNTHSLPFIISLFRNNCNATDPRDKVYGLLGLARSRYENVVSADYTQTVEAAFETATIQMIQQTESLEVLSHIPSVEPKLTLPSYVPDWTVYYKKLEHFSWLGWLSSIHTYDACKSEAARLTIVCHGCVQLKGITVDEIDMMSSTSVLDGKAGFSDALFSCIGLRNARAQSSGYQICDSDFWSAICGSQWYYVNESGISIQRITATEFQASGLLEKLTAWSSNSMSDFWEEYDQNPEVRNFGKLYGSVRVGRNFVITKNGRPAWCPRTCQKGDTIAVLAGGTVPFVLRKVENEKYRFIGDAYVQGIMDGEAVDEMHSNGKDWEDIQLI
ncbi:hypothetical protein EKO04_005792 [Ascochyta lentis]|uniref:Heterokaryon incompatibility domain-containing protein n=1 Tax=Ascochyta lentis TaxID=205686 RepID=A0A8H7MJQ3_9PLEO|nr:hypothetical protein EKO04_005792 [Ascochyta lentis]